MLLVLDYAENGQLIEWDEKKNMFITDPMQDEYFSEEKLRLIFRDIVKGMHYRKLKQPNLIF